MCQHSNVPTLTSSPVFKLLDSQGYLWLPYDLKEVIQLIGETFEPFFFSQKDTLRHSFQHYCHSFRNTVIPSGFLSFLPNFCHSFQIFVMPSRLVSFLPNMVMLSEYCHSFRIITISNICHPE